MLQAQSLLFVFFMLQQIAAHVCWCIWQEKLVFGDLFFHFRMYFFGSLHRVHCIQISLLAREAAEKNKLCQRTIHHNYFKIIFNRPKMSGGYVYCELWLINHNRCLTVWIQTGCLIKHSLFVQNIYQANHKTMSCMKTDFSSLRLRISHV